MPANVFGICLEHFVAFHETVCSGVGQNQTYVCKYNNMYEGEGGMQVSWSRNGL